MQVLPDLPVLLGRNADGDIEEGKEKVPRP